MEIVHTRQIIHTEWSAFANPIGQERHFGSISKLIDFKMDQYES